MWFYLKLNIRGIIYTMIIKEYAGYFDIQDDPDKVDEATKKKKNAKNIKGTKKETPKKNLQNK